MDRIVPDPAIMVGVPCIRGTRIPVATIGGLVAENVTVQEVLQHYPQLTAQDVQGVQPR